MSITLCQSAVKTVRVAVAYPTILVVIYLIIIYDRLAALRAQRHQQYASVTPAQGHTKFGPHPRQTVFKRCNRLNDRLFRQDHFYTRQNTGIRRNVTRISDFHSRLLNALDEIASQENASQLEKLVADTRERSNGVKERIQSLDKFSATAIPIQDPQTVKNRAFVRSKFVETFQRYQEVERQFRAKYQQRVERQVKIVKPDASPDEVTAVVNDIKGGGGQIFAKAISSSNRYGISTVAYREVQESHKDIRKIEQTLTELAQLYNDILNVAPTA